jgi:hypothetical protein
MEDFEPMKRGAWGFPATSKPDYVKEQAQKTLEVRQLVDTKANTVKYRDAFPKDYKLPTEGPREWTALMRGVRVEGDTVVIVAKGGNQAARELCGALIDEMNK